MPILNIENLLIAHIGQLMVAHLALNGGILNTDKLEGSVNLVSRNFLLRLYHDSDPVQRKERNIGMIDRSRG